MTPFLQIALGVTLLLLTLTAIAWTAFVAYLRLREQRRREAQIAQREGLLGGFAGDMKREITDLHEKFNEDVAMVRARHHRQAAGGL